MIDNAEPAVAHAETSTGNGSENGSVEKESRLVLGIETSCDETGAAVVSTDGRILGEALASSAAIHAQWGGVVPALAKGEHEKAIDGVRNEAHSSFLVPHPKSSFKQCCKKNVGMFYFV